MLLGSLLATLPRSLRALLAAAVLPLLASPASLAQSRWVHLGPDGNLVYAHLTTGDRIPDFSFAGYMAGGVALPTVPTKITITPSGTDDTAAIQKAIDHAARLPLVDGLRGAVELAPGVFHCSGTLNITASGVVLRGAGADSKGTTLQETGDPRVAIVISGKLNVSASGASTYLTDPYVPFGALSVHVNSGFGFHPGDIVRITKQATPAWVKAMGMDQLERPGRNEHWVSGDLSVRRRIASVAGNTIIFELALMDSYDAKYTGPVKMERVNVSGQITNVGVENLRVEAPARSAPLDALHSEGLNLNDAADSWVRSVNFVDTTEGVTLNGGTERITLLQVDVTQHKFVTSPAKPFDFSINGSQILVDRCSGTGDLVFYFATQARQQGPVVLLHSVFHGNGHIEPHQRWSTGLLVDSNSVPESEINLSNRGTMGTGHGWTIAWSISWNNTAAGFTIQQPPMTLNWSIGDIGQQQQHPMPASAGKNGPNLPLGQIEFSGKHVRPNSLYLQQLYERLGPQALTNIGYAPDAR
ncbi:MAG: hypothetical protein P4L10_01255 [Acidobacteriaceae bacterium]|nr:hypothetical protein [Acidobacteriaceae bacterium]